MRILTIRHKNRDAWSGNIEPFLSDVRFTWPSDLSRPSNSKASKLSLMAGKGLLESIFQKYHLIHSLG